jgi:hypothetical protein
VWSLLGSGDGRGCFLCNSIELSQPATILSVPSNSLDLSSYDKKKAHVVCLVGFFDGTVEVIDLVSGVKECLVRYLHSSTAEANQELTTHSQGEDGLQIGQSVVALSVSPVDSNLLLIGYQSGHVFIFDLKAKEPLKQFHLDVKTILKSHNPSSTNLLSAISGIKIKKSLSKVFAGTIPNKVSKRDSVDSALSTSSNHNNSEPPSASADINSKSIEIAPLCNAVWRSDGSQIASIHGHHFAIWHLKESAGGALLKAISSSSSSSRIIQTISKPLLVRSVIPATESDQNSDSDVDFGPITKMEWLNIPSKGADTQSLNFPSLLTIFGGTTSSLQEITCLHFTNSKDYKTAAHSHTIKSTHDIKDFITIPIADQIDKFAIFHLNSSNAVNISILNPTSSSIISRVPACTPSITLQSLPQILSFSLISLPLNHFTRLKKRYQPTETPNPITGGSLIIPISTATLPPKPATDLLAILHADATLSFWISNTLPRSRAFPYMHIHTLNLSQLVSLSRGSTSKLSLTVSEHTESLCAIIVSGPCVAVARMGGNGIDGVDEIGEEEMDKLMKELDETVDMVLETVKAPRFAQNGSDGSSAASKEGLERLDEGHEKDCGEVQEVPVEKEGGHDVINTQDDSHSETDAEKTQGDDEVVNDLTKTHNDGVSYVHNDTVVVDLLWRSSDPDLDGFYPVVREMHTQPVSISCYAPSWNL